MARVGLYALTLFAIGRLHELVSSPPGVVLTLGVLTIILAFMTPSSYRNPLWAQREIQLLFALSALAVLLAPFGVWPGGSIGFLKNSFGAVPVFCTLIVALTTSDRVVQNLVWCLLVGVGVLGIFTMLRTAMVSGRAYAGATYDPNDLAMVMVLTLPLAVFAAVGLRGVRRATAAAVAVVCIVTTIMTMSRGGFVGLGFVCVLLIFRLGTATLVPRLMILGATVGLVVIAAPEQYWTRMSTIWNPNLTGGGYDQTGVFSRVELWIHGLSLFLDNAVTGAGIGMYETVEGLSHGGRGKWSAAHNSFIQVATELGVVGFALFVALLVVSIRNVRRTISAASQDPGLRQRGRIAAAVEISLYAYVVLGFALSQAYSPMLYFLIGVAAVLRLLLERQRAGARPELPVAA